MISGQCFVIRPYRGRHKESQNVWELAIRPAVEALGLVLRDGEEGGFGAVIHQDIAKAIWESQVIIADTTASSPNVMYELGMAHAIKKNVIILVEESEDPPFDVRHIRYLTYDRHNLRKLERDLRQTISWALAHPSDNRPDPFPQLRVVTPQLQRELDSLRTRAVTVHVHVSPSFADVFLNDQLMAAGSCELRINPEADRNTISVSAIGFFEHHAEVQSDALNRGHIHVDLDAAYKLAPAKLSEHVSTRLLPRWLNALRKDPQNPVLLRAISSFQLMSDERDNALATIEDLLRRAPDWYNAVNQQGLFYGTAGDIARAKPYYSRVAAMKVDHFVGHFNLACLASLNGQFEEALRHLQAIVDNEGALASARATLPCLSHDPDLAGLFTHPEFEGPAQSLERTIFPEPPAERGFDSTYRVW